MKFYLTILVSLLITNAHSQGDFDGTRLYQYVEKYTSLGEHRTGTQTDFETSAWLGNELKSFGYSVSFLEFSLQQFFPGEVSIQSHARTIDAFPFWYVGKQSIGSFKGEVTTKSDPGVRGKIALVEIPAAESGQAGASIGKQFQDLVDMGVVGIIAYAQSAAGEIIAFNAPKAAKPWTIPIVIVSPADAEYLESAKGSVSITISGTIREVKARNVYGKIGHGGKYIVISTPISGWFTCGGERGPGIATWLALAKWASSLQSEYTFVFTGNSGHELGGWGAKAFLEEKAPPTDKTRLWIHLGAGIATVAWNSGGDQLIRTNEIDTRRNFFYAETVADAFTTSFKAVKGNKFEIKERAAGELVYVIEKGYRRVAGAAYSHPYFHMRSDDATRTSPEILTEVASAFRNFIQNDLKSSQP